jgi:hypothetical protein
VIFFLKTVGFRLSGRFECTQSDVSVGGNTSNPPGQKRQELYRVWGSARAPVEDATVEPPPASSEAKAEMLNDLDNFTRQALP